MKPPFYASLPSLLSLGILFLLVPACKKDKEQDSGSGQYYVGGKQISLSSTELHVETSGQDSTEVRNTLELFGNDGSKVQLEFMGEKEGLRAPLSTSLPRAYFTNTSGVQHESVDGNLEITQYKKENGNRTLSGEFEFEAQDVNGPGEVRISNGSFDHRDN